MVDRAAEREARVRHLQDVGAIVARLSQNSFTIRGWSVTLFSVVFAIIGTRSDGSRSLVLVMLAPTVIFWGLDAYYLRQERLYRRLYAAIGRGLVENGESAPVAFDMDVAAYRASVGSFLRTLLSPSVAAIPMMLSPLIVAFSLLGH